MVGWALEIILGLLQLLVNGWALEFLISEDGLGY